jgi:FtsH-binding integral membrane protein
VIAFSAGGGACLIALFALFAIQATAYKESIKEGLLCSLTILYSFYYMFSRLKSRRLGNTVMIFWISAIVAGICLGYSLPKI